MPTHNKPMKTTTNLNNVIDLLQTEALLERHLEDVRQDIRRDCAEIAAHSPGVKTAPDIEIVDVYLPLEGEAMVILDRLGCPDIRVIVEPHWRVPMSEDELEGVE